mmetsp:Transcript_21207/g.54305  ORF Transcript_21207/g.54305 Transcript_21207/m.54305 type:complete len:206 (+) Transcript_21207:2192-2809(+)
MRPADPPWTPSGTWPRPHSSAAEMSLILRLASLSDVRPAWPSYSELSSSILPCMSTSGFLMKTISPVVDLCVRANSALRAALIVFSPGGLFGSGTMSRTPSAERLWSSALRKSRSADVTPAVPMNLSGFWAMRPGTMDECSPRIRSKPSSRTRCLYTCTASRSRSAFLSSIGPPLPALAPSSARWSAIEPEYSTRILSLPPTSWL